MTTEKQEKVMAEKYDYEKADLFLNCKKCMEELPDDVAPIDYCRTQMSTYMPKELEGTRVLVYWCTRHKEQIWDSRHLKHAF